MRIGQKIKWLLTENYFSDSFLKKLELGRDGVKTQYNFSYTVDVCSSAKIFK